MKYFYNWLCILFFAVQTLAASAQPESTITLEELRWVDTGYLQRQRALVDDIGRTEFGTRIRGDKSDLRLLQRILDNDLINQTELAKLQALGVILGDVYVKDLGLEWQVYLDDEGKSRAVCLPGTTHCLFPITMISKRASLGVKPDVQDLYNRGISLIQDHLPKTPYQVAK